MPQKFRVADGGASFATGRKVYRQFANKIQGNLSTGANAGRYGPDLINAFAMKPGCCLSTTKLEKNPGNPLFRHVREVGKPVSGNKSMIVTADDYIQRKKNMAIGRGTSVVRVTPDSNLSQLGLKGYANQMSVTQAKRKARSSGYVVPPKCRGHGGGPSAPGLCCSTTRPNGGHVTALYS